MPHIETPPDLAEWLADQIGVWGAEDRSQWVAEVTERIRDSVENEMRLQRPAPAQRGRVIPRSPLDLTEVLSEN